MVRIRAYSLVLSLPVLLAVGGCLLLFLPTGLVDGKGFTAGAWTLFAAIVIHVFLGLVIACPICGKSPYTVGPFRGALGAIGKPVPDSICTNCGHDFVAHATPTGWDSGAKAHKDA